MLAGGGAAPTPTAAAAAEARRRGGGARVGGRRRATRSRRRRAPAAPLEPRVDLVVDEAALAGRGVSAAEALADALNRVFGRLVAVVNAWGGDIISWCGDAMIIVWHNAQVDQQHQQLPLLGDDDDDDELLDGAGLGSFPENPHLGAGVPAVSGPDALAARLRRGGARCAGGSRGAFAAALAARPQSSRPRSARSRRTP